MPNKQTVQIAVEKNEGIILELYSLRSSIHPRDCESSVGGAVCEDRFDEIRIKPHQRIIRIFSLLAAIIVKTINRLNQVGSGKIDEKRMEDVQNQCLGLRIRGINR
jgi:hypothetical protein